MNTIFTTDDPSEYIDKINLDELYEKKRQHDVTTTNNYKTILNRIHTKIKTTSRQQLSEQYCWFVVPEMMIGVPKYESDSCIAYVIDKLQENGFKIRYTHPNMLFISWQHWVPEYVRSEIKKKIGADIVAKPTVEAKEDGDSTNKNLTPDSLFKVKNKVSTSNQNTANTKSIDSYKPTGQLIYNNDILNSLKNNLDK